MVLHKFVFTSDMTTGERNVYDCLVDLYSHVVDDREVYIIYDHPVGYSGDSPGRPDFIIIDSMLGIAIVEVKDCYESRIEELITTTIRHTGGGGSSKNPVFKVDDYSNLVKGLLKNNEASQASGSISTHLSFTNIKRKSKTAQSLNGVGRSGHSKLHFKKDFFYLGLDDLFYFKRKLGPDLTKKVISILRPYLVFEQDSDKITRQRERSNHISLLDEKQLSAVRSNPIGHFMVTGIPGSGKSVAVSNRALYLNSQKPDWRVLVLCFNKPLSKKIKERIKIHLNRLDQAGLDVGNIQVKTLHKHCFDIAKQNNIEIQGRDDRERCESAIKIALDNVKPDYDAVLIDEYQDFTDDWIKIALGSAKIHTARDKKEQSLFLAGDRLQQIKEEGMSSTWSALGVNVTSGKRSFLLKTSYRNCKRHLSIALEFLKQHKSLRSEVEKFYEGDRDVQYELEENLGEIQSSRRYWGGAFQEVQFSVQRLIQKGVRPEDVLVITPSGKVHNSMRNCLKNHRGVIVETPKRVKGLEAPYVFILNADYFLQDKYMSEVSLRKLMYMLLTRSNFFTYINTFSSDNEIVEEVLSIISDSLSDEAA